MEELEVKIVKLETELKTVLKTISEVNEENFDQKMERLEFLNQKIISEREYLISNYDREELKVYNIKFDKYIKEITESFDNIIRQNKEKQKVIKNQLNISLNSKKLLNYQR